MATQTNFSDIGIPKRGKVRDIYNLGNQLLIVVTNRISAFDVVMNEEIPLKGGILNQLSTLWFKRLGHIVPNHFITCDLAKYPEVCQPYAEPLRICSMLVKKAKPLPVECVVRGYLSGSAWSDYKKSKPTCGITLLPGLKESEKLPEPIFTPTTKAESGHDLPICFDEMGDFVGWELAGQIRDISLELYLEGAKLAEQAGIIIADTKFEFGLDDDGNLMLIDEVLTPDSSRFWPAEGYEPGKPQPSFDKQYLRDYLEAIGWNKQPPPPALPQEIINRTSAKYVEAWKSLNSVL